MRGASLLLVGLLSLTLAGCEKPPPLAIELVDGEGFDPLRYDPGPEPEGELGVDGLRFATTPFYTRERQRKMLERMRGWLEEKVGVPVQAEVAESYGAAVEELARGELDVAQLAPYACVQAQRLPEKITLLATAIAQGTRTYASYLVVRHDSDIDRPADAKGMRLALTGRSSASGFLYPWAWLKRHGLVPERDFELSLYGQHDAVLDALLAGEVDIGAVSSDTLVSAGVLGLSGPIRIIGKPGRIPYDCIAARADLSPRLLWRLERAFLTLSILSHEGRDVLSDYNLVNGFIPVPEGHYDDVGTLQESFGAEVEEAVERLQGAAPHAASPSP